uniref:U46-Liphistoxin-Lsp1a_1 n=2 Tax=Liphistius TaxID=62150 RepID=A0A4Q8K120_9ARAC
MKILLVIFLCSALFLQGVFCADLGSCNKPEDCGPGECCTIGMFRYAKPQCLPMLKEGANCRVGNAPEDKIFYYPDGQIQTTGVYRTLCPCDSGLSCIRGKCISVKQF